MASQAPLVLLDNVFDRINQYPAATLASSGDAPNRVVAKVADYRRERTYWLAASAAADRWVSSDLGVGNTAAIDFVFIDRGHNLWGKSMTLRGDDGAGGGLIGPFTALVVPALDGTGNFVVGGDPTVGWSVTEEGALYTLFALTAAKRRWLLYCSSIWTPQITGLIIGKRTQLANYSHVLDEDGGGRKKNSDESEAGYTGASRVYPWREFVLELSVIGATEYDGNIRTLRRGIFERNIPIVVAINYGRWPERTWMYQLNADRWSAPTRGVHRSASIPLRELYPVIR